MSDKPEPKICTYCKHVYIKNCDGKPDCPNRIWLDERRKGVTKLDFIALCGKYLIEPNIALENDNLRKALEERNDEEVERILREEF